MLIPTLPYLFIAEKHLVCVDAFVRQCVSASEQSVCVCVCVCVGVGVCQCVSAREKERGKDKAHFQPKW